MLLLKSDGLALHTVILAVKVMAMVMVMVIVTVMVIAALKKLQFILRLTLLQ